MALLALGLSPPLAVPELQILHIMLFLRTKFSIPCFLQGNKPITRNHLYHERNWSRTSCNTKLGARLKRARSYDLARSTMRKGVDPWRREKKWWHHELHVRPQKVHTEVFWPIRIQTACRRDDLSTMQLNVFRPCSITMSTFQRSL